MTRSENPSSRMLDVVLDIVNEWQLAGRSGYCFPGLGWAILDRLEILADGRRRDNCSICGGSGLVDEVECSHCKPLYGT